MYQNTLTYLVAKKLWLLLAAALIIGLAVATAPRPAAAHVYEPPQIPHECARFAHLFQPYQTFVLNSQAYQTKQFVSSDGSYGGNTKCDEPGTIVRRLWNVRIDNAANRKIRIVPNWGLKPPDNKTICLESNVVYKVWVTSDYFAYDVRSYKVVGGGRLYGAWVEGDPGYCRWQSDNPGTPTVENEPTQTNYTTGSSDKYMLVSAQAFVHPAPTYQSARVMVFVYPK
jgi:hypothetical protein